MRIADKIDQLAVNPDDPELDVKPLEGTELFKLRVGSWRVIFGRFDTLKVIAIEKIGARGDVYK